MQRLAKPNLRILYHGIAPEFLLHEPRSASRFAEHYLVGREFNRFKYSFSLERLGFAAPFSHAPLEENESLVLLPAPRRLNPTTQRILDHAAGHHACWHPSAAQCALVRAARRRQGNGLLVLTKLKLLAMTECDAVLPALEQLAAEAPDSPVLVALEHGAVITKAGRLYARPWPCVDGDERRSPLYPQPAQIAAFLGGALTASFENNGDPMAILTRAQANEAAARLHESEDDTTPHRLNNTQVDRLAATLPRHPERPLETELTGKSSLSRLWDKIASLLL